MSVRVDIVKQYAAWKVLSELRMGAPIRSKEEIYPLIAKVNFSPVLDQAVGHIDIIEFEKWHKNALETAICANPKMRNQYGWAAKIINIYLKTYCNVGDAGRSGIRTYLHPPIDSGLWIGCPLIEIEQLWEHW